MKRKKLLTVLLSMTLVVSLAGCGGAETSSDNSSSGKENVTLTVWHQYLPATEKKLEDSFKEFTKETGIKIKFQKMEDIDNKIDTAAQSGKLPDLIIRASDRVGRLSVMGAIEPLDNYVSKADLKDTMKTGVDAFTYNGKLYGVPGHMETVTLIYNKDLISDPPKTTDELLQKSKELTKNGIYGFLIPPKDGYFNSCFFSNSNKFKFLTKDGKAAINSKQNVETLKYLQNLSQNSPKDLDSSMISNLFDDKKAAMIISGPWEISKLKELKINYGLALIPTLSSTGKSAAPYVNSQGMMMTSSCKNKEAAVKAMKYYLGSNVAMAYFNAGGYIPTNNTIYSKNEVKADKDVVAFKKQADVGVATPNIPEMGVVWQPVSDLLQETVVLKQDPQAAVEKYQKKAEDSISNMK